MERIRSWWSFMCMIISICVSCARAGGAEWNAVFDDKAVLETFRWGTVVTLSQICRELPVLSSSTALFPPYVAATGHSLIHPVLDISKLNIIDKWENILRWQEKIFLSHSDVLGVLLLRENGSPSSSGMGQHVPVSLKLSSGERVLLLSLRRLTYEVTLLAQNSKRKY